MGPILPVGTPTNTRTSGVATGKQTFGTGEVSQDPTIKGRWANLRFRPFSDRRGVRHATGLREVAEIGLPVEQFLC